MIERIWWLLPNRLFSIGLFHVRNRWSLYWHMSRTEFTTESGFWTPLTCDPHTTDLIDGCPSIMIFQGEPAKRLRDYNKWYRNYYGTRTKRVTVGLAFGFNIVSCSTHWLLWAYILDIPECNFRCNLNLKIAGACTEGILRSSLSMRKYLWSGTTFR